MHKRMVAVGAAILAGAVTVCAPAWSAPADGLRLLDRDQNGKVDMGEAKSAATAVFDRLDRDHDGTLDKRELRNRVSAKELKAADPDNDGTLDKGEYLSIVEQRFRAANPDKDDTLEANELKSKPGRSLMRLLQ